MTRSSHYKIPSEYFIFCFVLNRIFSVIDIFLNEKEETKLLVTERDIFQIKNREVKDLFTEFNVMGEIKCRVLWMKQVS